MPRQTVLVAVLGILLLTIAPFVFADAPLPLGDEKKEAALARIDSLWSAGKREPSQALILPLLEGARAEDDSLFLMKLLSRQGAHWVAMGKVLEAEVVLGEAVGLSEALRDSVTLCSSVRWFGLAIGIQGRQGDARVQYRRLLDLARAIGDRSHEAWGQVGLAQDAFLNGRAEEAANRYREATRLFRDVGEAQGEIWAQNGLGTALENLGSAADAGECYRRVVILSREAGLTMTESMALNNLGCLEYLYGAPSRAERYYQSAYDLQCQHGHQREAINTAANMALCQIDLGHYQEAERNLLDRLQECTEGGYLDLEGVILNRLAVMKWEQGLYHEAATLSRQALELGNSISMETRIACYIGLANALDDTRDHAEALEALEEGIDYLPTQEFPRWRVSLELYAARQLMALSRHEEALERLVSAESVAVRHGLDRVRIDTAIDAGRTYRALDEPDSALALLRRAARLWELARGVLPDPEWREQRAVLVRRLSTELATMILESESLQPDGYSVGEAFNAVQGLKARTLQDRMLGPGKRGSAVDRPDTLRLATLDRIQRDVLRPDECLMDAHIGPERSILFAITTVECRAIRLPAETEINARIHPFHRLLSSQPEGDISKSELNAIDSVGIGIAWLLFSEVTDMIAGRNRIIIAPDGALNLLPLSALLLQDLILDEDPAGDAGVEIVRVPSASILMKQRTTLGEMEPRAPATILAVAGRTNDRGDDLSGAVREVRRLGKRFEGVQVRILPDATPGFGVDELAGYDILHLASHVRTDNQNPWQSEIQLSPGDETGSLRAAEIAGLSLSTRLVVLSSCQSVGGRILSGEGVLGLSSAFISADVPAVLATLWSVDDATTAGFMDRFYAELAAGSTVATAVREAQNHLRASPGTRHPFYWAGFTVIGDGQIRMTLRERPRPTWIPLAAILVVAGAAAVAWRLRRRV